MNENKRGEAASPGTRNRRLLRGIGLFLLILGVLQTLGAASGWVVFQAGHQVAVAGGFSTSESDPTAIAAAVVFGGIGSIGLLVAVCGGLVWRKARA
jgi:hypothetical protein